MTDCDKSQVHSNTVTAATIISISQVSHFFLYTHVSIHIYHLLLSCIILISCASSCMCLSTDANACSSFLMLLHVTLMGLLHHFVLSNFNKHHIYTVSHESILSLQSLLYKVKRQNYTALFKCNTSDTNNIQVKHLQNTAHSFFNIKKTNKFI